MNEQDTTRKEQEAGPDQAEGPKKRTWVEEIEVTGSQLIERISDLIQESNTQRVIIRTQDGSELMTVPLTVGVVAGGILTFAAPLWAALGALAALVTRVKLEVIREEPETEDRPEDKSS